ncbi:signal recognition particle 14 kDa protein [Patella vulgata]|uniref:signal recognition particle 14 kDa protein n=1 Tax=Patella vulgata TaxID=6465 RepID=UPI0021809470|nr:signal recognition particle 14 kDa protein [Patella vulgata]
MLLENDAFLSELTRMFQRSKNSGSVSITMKRWDGHNKPKPRTGNPPEPTEYKCLFRATARNKKISTVVSQKDVTKFQMAYCTLLKGNLVALKRGEKKDTTKKKTKAT